LSTTVKPAGTSDTASTRSAFTVAVLSDVHGNAAALRAVLADLATQPHHRLVVAGDLARPGPRPAESLDALRALDPKTTTIIQGNSDRRLASGRGHPAVLWGRTQVGPERLAWLAALPFDCRITPPCGASPADDLLVVHATPTNMSAVLTVEPDPFGQLDVTPEARARELLGDATANLILAGHVHYASSGVAAGRRFATVGSVGFPWDGDHRAAYALVTWDGAAWRPRHRRVAYDHQSVIDELRRIGTPFAHEAAERLAWACIRPDLVR
jgi:predicted phosphodiesterase